MTVFRIALAHVTRDQTIADEVAGAVRDSGGTIEELNRVTRPDALVAVMSPEALSDRVWQREVTEAEAQHVVPTLR